MTTSETLTPTLSEMIRSERDRIVAQFIADVAAQALPPGPASKALLIDHIPHFLDELARELQGEAKPRATHDAIKTSDVSQLHGEQRWGMGYDVEAVVREYGLLRHAILDAARRHGLALTIDEFDVLARCLNVGVAEAVRAYADQRDEQFRSQRANLEYLAEAGDLLGSSLDHRSTMTHLTRLLVPRIADFCAIHLEGTDEAATVAHADESQASTARRLFLEFPFPASSPFGHHHAAVTGAPFMASSVGPETLSRMAQGPEQLELLRQLQTCSWLVVPLRVHGTSLGALTVAFGRSGRRYSEDDLVLAKDIARRAAAAIENARLYAMSQRERSRVEAAIRVKDDFVAMISHELRTPMTAIIGWLDMIKSGTLPRERAAHALEVIDRNARAQHRLIADLVDVSKILSGRLRINPSQVDLSNVVDLAVEGVRPAADAKRIRLETAIDREHSIVRADGIRMQQVAWHLLANAVKFTPKGGVVTVTLRRVESDIELVVADSGEGIPAEFLPHVFETFQQEDMSASRRHGGLGLGLSITKYLVELHGGSVRASSEGKGRGAQFVARIPVSPLVSPTYGVSSALSSSVSTWEPSPSLQGLRVLVVDDDQDGLELLRFLLQDRGVTVHAVSSVAAAIDELRQHPIDLVISDVGMPIEDGYALIRRIRTMEDATKRDVPVIALTAFATTEDRVRALVAGFNHHIGKPVESSVLIAAMIQLTTRRVEQ